MKIFKKRGELTKFQILSEISKQNPYLRQKHIANNLGITVQAVSENIKNLIDEGFIEAREGRSTYKLTKKGIERVKSNATILKDYSEEVLNVMNHYKTIWPAIATEDFKKGEKVGLKMDDGILYAVRDPQNANAYVLEDAKEGEDIGLTSLSGIIDVENGEVVVIRLPTMKNGGSKSADLELISEIYQTGFKRWGRDLKFDRVGIMGTISRSVTNKLDIPVDFEFATIAASESASKRGLNTLVFAVGNMTKSIAKTLEEENIKYTLVDAEKKEEDFNIILKN